MAASCVVIAFFVTSWPAVYDTHFYLDWNRAIARYGPIGIYSHAENLNYPPLIVYLLWLYGLVANPLGLGESYSAIKLLMALAVPLLVLLVWHSYASLPNRPAYLAPVVLMLGVSVGAIYNPAIYGQSDAPLALLLVASFLLIQQGRANGGGILLALSLLYKLQAIYLVPLLLLLMLRRTGWRKTAFSSLLGLLVALALTLPTFGFSLEALSRYWNQGQLAGDGLLEYGAFNLLDLLNANNGQVGWVVPFGFGVIGLVYLGLGARLWFGKQREGGVALASALATLVCFLFAIKVKQHYLYYPLPFLGLAALWDRRLIKPWLLLGGVYSLMLIVSPVLSRRGIIFDNFLTWNRLLQTWHPAFEDGLALAGLLLFGLLLGYYIWDWWKYRASKPD